VAQGNSNQIFPIFFGVWVALGLSSAGFFLFSKNAKLKRKVWPPLVVVTSVMFIGFAWVMGMPVNTFYLMLPAVALITLLNLRAARFCVSCGATIMSQNPFSKPAFCHKCGAKLDQ